MKRLILSLVLSLLLYGCSSTPTNEPLPEATASKWTPPVFLSDEVRAISEALSLCKSFAEEMNRVYPDYAPVLSDQDTAYFQNHCSDSDADLNALSSELTLTIVSLRQQVYLRMEETLKLNQPLPDGLEQFVRNFETALHEIGW